MTDYKAFTQLRVDKMCPLKHSPYQKPQASDVTFVTTAQVQLLRLLISWVSELGNYSVSTDLLVQIIITVTGSQSLCLSCGGM